MKKYIILFMLLGTIHTAFSQDEVTTINPELNTFETELIAHQTVLYNSLFSLTNALLHSITLSHSVVPIRQMFTLVASPSEQTINHFVQLYNTSGLAYSVVASIQAEMWALAIILNEATNMMLVTNNSDISKKSALTQLKKKLTDIQTLHETALINKEIIQATSYFSEHPELVASHLGCSKATSDLIKEIQTIYKEQLSCENSLTTLLIEGDKLFHELGHISNMLHAVDLLVSTEEIALEKTKRRVQAERELYASLFDPFASTSFRSFQTSYPIKISQKAPLKEFYTRTALVKRDQIAIQVNPTSDERVANDLLLHSLNTLYATCKTHITEMKNRFEQTGLPILRKLTTLSEDLTRLEGALPDDTARIAATFQKRIIALSQGSSQSSPSTMILEVLTQIVQSAISSLEHMEFFSFYNIAQTHMGLLREASMVYSRSNLQAKLYGESKNALIAVAPGNPSIAQAAPSGKVSQGAASSMAGSSVTQTPQAGAESSANSSGLQLDQLIATRQNHGKPPAASTELHPLSPGKTTQLSTTQTTSTERTASRNAPKETNLRSPSGDERPSFLRRFFTTQNLCIGIGVGASIYYAYRQSQQPIPEEHKAVNQAT